MKKYLYYARSIIELLTGFKPIIKVIAMFLQPAGRPETWLDTPIQKVCLRNPALAFHVRGKMDAWSIKETFLDRFYIRPGFGAENGWTVVDIGAGIGEYTIQAAYGRPESTVYAFEPFPGSFQLLEQNLELNAVHNARIFRKAVWSQAGRLELDLSGGEPLMFSSRQGQGGRVVEKPGVIEVESLSLADVLSQNNLAYVDLLKLDCEGAEYEILLTAGAQTLVCIRRIVMEYHDNDPARNHHRLVEYLASQGYQVETVPNQVHRSLGYLFAMRPQAG